MTFARYKHEHRQTATTPEVTCNDESETGTDAGDGYWIPHHGYAGSYASVEDEPEDSTFGDTFGQDLIEAAKQARAIARGCYWQRPLRLLNW